MKRGNDIATKLLEALKKKREIEDAQYGICDLNNKSIMLSCEDGFKVFQNIQIEDLSVRKIVLERKNPSRIHFFIKHDIGKNCTIGDGVYLACCEIGNNVYIGEGTSIEDNISLADNIYLGKNVSLYGILSIKENVRIGNGTKIKGAYIMTFEVNTIYSNVKIGDNCIIEVSLGSNTVINDNTKIINTNGISCLLGKNSNIGKNCLIVDCILGLNYSENIGNNFQAENICTMGKNTFGDYVKIGNKTNIGINNHFGNNINIGNSVTIENSNIIENDVIIGNNTRIGNSQNYTFPTKIFIGKYSNVGDYVFIDNNVHISDGVIIGNDVKVGEFTTIGKNAIINKSARIGKNVIIENGATVAEGDDIPDNSKI